MQRKLHGPPSVKSPGANLLVSKTTNHNGSARARSFRVAMNSGKKGVAQPKILVFATQNTPLAARISIALGSIGFAVAALTPCGHPARRVRAIQSHFTCHTGLRSKSAVRAINRWSPDLLVCTDDLAVRELQSLHRRMAASSDASSRRVSYLIERSLGPSTNFTAMSDKSALLALAAVEGLRCPKTIVVPASRPFPSGPPELTYPIVVKADHSEGGRCVRIVDDEAGLHAAVWELQTPSTWRFRQLFGAILRSRVLGSFTLPLRRTISLQQYIPGRPSNRAVICWKGQVLAGTSVEAVEVSHEQGPASVVRVIDHFEMAKTAEHLVKRLNLSGFVGFDFVLDFENRAWLLEMNPRVTPICHLSVANTTSLAERLYEQMTGKLPLSRPAPMDGRLVALFPDGIISSPSGNSSPSLNDLEPRYFDVPWSEPNLVSHVLNRKLRARFRTRVRAFLERHFPWFVVALLRFGLIDARTEGRRPRGTMGNDALL